MFALLVVAAGLWLGVATAQRVARHGAGGMTASMAAMMAAMGTGLSVGYAAGMIWDLGWANLAGVAAGFGHGLWMGRRYGPMAALEGAGGGVMGGLMGPMLAVMLLYLPSSLALTAVLMLAVQAAFSAGAVYLTAPTGAGMTGWLGLVGRALGAEREDVAATRDHYAVLGVARDAGPAEVAEAFLVLSRRAASEPAQLEAAREALAVLTDPVRRAKYEAARQEDAVCCPPKVRARRQAAREAEARRARRGLLLRAAALVGGVACVFLLFGGAFVPDATVAQAPPTEAPRPGGGSGAAPSTGADALQPSATTAAAGGVQQASLKLQGGSYTPKLVEVKRGVPVRLTLEAVGDPG